MKYTLHCKRYRESVCQVCETLEEAIQSAAGDLDANEAWPSHVTDENGVTVLTHSELMSRVFQVLDGVVLEG